MGKPVVIDLCCGLGGWSRAFLDEGWDGIGFDIERHHYGDKRYPGELILADVLTLNGYDLRAANPALVVASPPCQRYSYMAMPFSRGKRLAAWYRGQITSRVHADGSETLEPVESSEDRQRFASERQAQLNALYRACFRIAAQLGVPIVLENVKGAQPWVGKAKWHYGSYYLWGDVPALMPHTLRTVKQEGRNFHFPEKFGIPSVRDALALKTVGHANKRDGYSHMRHLTNQRESDAVREECGKKTEGAWMNCAYADRGTGPWQHSSGSDSRKAASALIAQIPYDLAQWIARCFKP